MQFWRSTLGIQGHPENEMQAVPDEILTAVRQHALHEGADQIVALLSSWSRFAVLMLAELNKAIMDAHRQQQVNREKWTKHGGDGDDKGRDEGQGDETSMMQRSLTSATPVYDGMARLQEAFDLLRLSDRRQGRTLSCSTYVVLLITDWDGRSSALIESSGRSPTNPATITRRWLRGHRCGVVLGDPWL